MEKQIVNIGPRLKQRRKEMHIKQIDMAKQLGVSQAFLSNVEAGRINCSLPSHSGEAVVDESFKEVGEQTNDESNDNANPAGASDEEINETKKEYVFIPVRNFHVGKSFAGKFGGKTFDQFLMTMVGHTEVERRFSEFQG